LSLQRVYEGVRGCIDRRQFNGRRATVASLSVDQFFLELYHSAAESLPEMPDCEVANVDWSIAADEEAKVSVLSPESTEGCQKRLESAVFDWDPGSALLRDQLELGTQAKLPMKHIQHSKPIDLWWLYLAWVSLRCPLGSSAACWSTFWRRWSSYWSSCVGLRKQTQHAQCNDCS
jgi:hypothetical protein